MTDHDPGAVTERPRPRVSLKIEEIIMGVAMAAMALITGANVLTRYLTNVSFAFTEEYSVLLMVIVALVGSSYAMAGGRHIRIGFLVDDMAPRWRRPAEVIAMVLAIACFGVLVVWGGLLTWDEYRFESMTPGLGNPQWIYTGMLPLLSLLVVARAAGRLVRLLRGANT
jgi:TRAP-type C4-dicarboxylate transport system permease small subunit